METNKISFSPTHKIIFETGQLPRPVLPGDSTYESFFARIKAIKFKRKFKRTVCPTKSSPGANVVSDQVQRPVGRFYKETFKCKK